MGYVSSFRIVSRVAGSGYESPLLGIGKVVDDIESVGDEDSVSFVHVLNPIQYCGAVGPVAGSVDFEVVFLFGQSGRVSLHWWQLATPCWVVSFVPLT